MTSHSEKRVCDIGFRTWQAELRTANAARLLLNELEPALVQGRPDGRPDFTIVIVEAGVGEGPRFVVGEIASSASLACTAGPPNALFCLFCFQGFDEPHEPLGDAEASLVACHRSHSVTLRGKARTAWLRLLV